jgi:hypothetical protein
MTSRPIIFTTVVLFSLTACSDKAASEASKAKEHFMSEQQKLLEQAKEVKDAATEAIEKQKKALEDLQNK